MRAEHMDPGGHQESLSRTPNWLVLVLFVLVYSPSVEHMMARS